MSSEIAVQFMAKGTDRDDTASGKHLSPLRTEQRGALPDAGQRRPLGGGLRYMYLRAHVDGHPPRRAEPLRPAGVAAARRPAAGRAARPDAGRSLAVLARGGVRTGACAQSGKVTAVEVEIKLEV